METDLPTRVLIVDDEGPLLRSLERAAAGPRRQVDIARDGEQGWEMLQQRHYDLVVSDLRMPKMGGPELLGRIHEQELRTRVMVITGHASLNAAVDCLRKGAIDFLVKPFRVESFVAAVDRALARPVPPPRSAEPDWDEVNEKLRLSPRQKEVLITFYRTGGSNRELGELLCMSPYTVKSHLKVAFLRTRVKTRAQLLQWVRRFLR